MKITTMTLSGKRQAVFPLEWCKRFGLLNGGPLNVFDMGDGVLIIRPPRPPNAELIEKLFEQCPPLKGNGLKIVNKILREDRKARRESSRH